MGRKRMTAILSGGAMRVTDAKNKCAEMAEDCIGFLELRSHGDIDAHVSLADDTPSGQFEFYFCSTRCLRAFLNGCIDALELKIEEKRSKR